MLVLIIVIEEKRSIAARFGKHMTRPGLEQAVIGASKVTTYNLFILQRRNMCEKSQPITDTLDFYLIRTIKEVVVADRVGRGI